MKIAVLGAGAFGTALAVALAREGEAVGLWARNRAAAAEIQATRQNRPRLPDITLPKTVSVSSDLADFSDADTLLLAVPAQELSGFVDAHREYLARRALVACMKGIDLKTLSGPIEILSSLAPRLPPALLTGPSFAADIARGLPTALTLACRSEEHGALLQDRLSTPILRLYRTTDTTGAELGGALKNVIAIAAGIVIGAGLGDSARAALMTRGFAEMTRLALHLGAQAETLGGLSGLGDLVLTCTSAQSRNFRYGLSLGQNQPFDPTITVEGAATARAVSRLADSAGIEMPIAEMVAAMVDRRIGLQEAVATLMSRPLKKEST